MAVQTLQPDLTLDVFQVEVVPYAGLQTEQIVEMDRGVPPADVAPVRLVVVPVQPAPEQANIIRSQLPETTVPQPNPYALNPPKSSTLGTSNADIMTGTAGREQLLGLDGDDQIRGLGGGDHILGGKGNDILDGGAGRDLMYGGDGNDLVWGGAGGDELYGDAGDDVIDGGGGADVLWGGAGGDAFVFGNGDVVMDFNPGQGDTILFAASLGVDPSKVIQIQTQTGLELGVTGKAARMLLEGYYGTLDLGSDVAYDYVPTFDFL